jgi:hypothetical protein
MTGEVDRLPMQAAGLQLHRIVGERLIACEKIRFVRGRPAVQMTLLRAAIAGRVDVGGKIEDHFADVLDDDGSMIETVALDAKSYRSLKTRWMRCKTLPED